MKKKYYAVARGKQPGVYLTWDACKMQVDHFSGAVYKSFPTEEEAKAFIEEIAGASYGNCKDCSVEEQGELKNTVSTKDHLVAYVDGSYEQSQRAYAYGCVLVFGNKVIEWNGRGNEESLVDMRNVAGEILGCQCAVSWAIENGYSEITIFYDYEGIEKWAIGAWKANKPGTIAYKNFMEENRAKIAIHFQKVAAHTGVEYNERADKLAKAALGI